MDGLSLFIIVISVLLAVLFKLVILTRISHWMDRDMIKALAHGDHPLEQKLQTANERMRADKVSRNERHSRLEALAIHPEPDTE